MHLFHVGSKALIGRIVATDTLHYKYRFMDLATVIYAAT